MAMGKVDPSQVTKITTHLSHPDDYDPFIEDYLGRAWKRCTEKAEALFEQFVREGRIEFGRPMPEDGQPYWFESEDQIKFQ
jgi:hypothetical protein